jgi:acetyl esterase/lipase
MSIQNLLLRQYLSLRIKRRLASAPSFESMRGELDDAIATYMPPPPSDIEIDTKGEAVAECVRPKDAAVDLTVLYFHGGGFVMGSPATYRGVSCALAREAGCEVVVPRYRLAPEQPYPAALEDARRAYEWTLARGVAPRHLVVAGDQAGAWLAFALLLALRDACAAMPAACVALSPFVDLTLSAPSIVENAGSDPAGIPDALRRCVDAFAPRGDRGSPALSPLFADLKGLPPSLIQASTIELLRDDARRMAAALKQHGVAVTLSEWNKVPSMWHIFAAGLPEARHAIREIARFLREVRIAKASRAASRSKGR